MNIWLHKCHKCGEVIDLQECPFCRERKLKEVRDGRKKNL